MKKTERSKEIITRKQIISQVAGDLNLYKESVEEVYSAIESFIVQSLMEADENKDIVVFFTDGIKLKGDFLEEHYHEHPRTKEPVLVPKKIRFGCSFTKYFKDIKNKEFRESRAMLDEWLESRSTKE